jgi:hypothetical protein
VSKGPALADEVRSLWFDAQRYDSRRSRWITFGIVLGIFSISAAFSMRSTGDWAEYAGMTRGLLAHGTPDVRETDLAWACRAGGLPDNTFKLGPPGFEPARNGSFYSIHFWFYSLLAAPWVAILAALGASPLLGFGLLNALCLAGAVTYAAERRSPTSSTLATLAVLSCGGSFYVGWLGPETLTASALLVACIAAARGALGIGTLAGGVAATQNPSAVVVVPFVWSAWLLLRRRPDAKILSLSRQTAIAVGVGVLLLALPYAFFRLRFGVFSLIGTRYVDFHEIGVRRLLSLVFDLNQGMAVGFPGLLLAAAILTIFALRTTAGRERWKAAGTAVFTAACFMGLALPTLAQRNWNADGVVVIRYAYWVAMPLLALVFTLLPTVTKGARGLAIGGLFSAQALSLLVHGVFGQRASYIEHGWLARWVLLHAPTKYNPVPEIFWERTLHSEDPLTDATFAAYPGRGYATKVLAHWSLPISCDWYGEPGLFLTSQHVVDAGSGFRYLNAPFSCAKSTTPQVFRANTRSSALTLERGWSSPESTGVWTDAAQSSLSIVLPAGFQARTLRFHGHYYKSTFDSWVTVNGHALGRHALSDAALALPPLGAERTLTVTLFHLETRSPRAMHESDDPRLLAYFLTAIGVE